MQNLKLPITIDPYRSAQRSLECEGIYETSGMNRLLAACESSSEHVHVKINFGVDELGVLGHRLVRISETQHKHNQKT